MCIRDRDYIDGMVDKLCSPLMAAFGKIEVETEELQPKEIIEDWVTYIKNRCTAVSYTHLDVYKRQEL